MRTQSGIAQDEKHKLLVFIEILFTSGLFALPDECGKFNTWHTKQSCSK